jgi:hypothetical protein
MAPAHRPKLVTAKLAKERRELPVEMSGELPHQPVLPYPGISHFAAKKPEQVEQPGLRQCIDDGFDCRLGSEGWQVGRRRPKSVSVGLEQATAAGVYR